MRERPKISQRLIGGWQHVKRHHLAEGKLRLWPVGQRYQREKTVKMKTTVRAQLHFAIVGREQAIVQNALQWANTLKRGVLVSHYRSNAIRSEYAHVNNFL